MQVSINDTAHDIPFNLADIPLGKFIEYYDAYGRDLDKHLESIIKKDYAKDLSAKWSVDIDEVSNDDILLHRQMDLDDHLDNEAITWFSFWTGADLFKIKEDQKAIMPLLSQYRVLKNLLIEDSNIDRAFPVEIEWNGELWSIQPYTVNAASEMTFNEIISSKEVMRQIQALGQGKWEALIYLACVYFRKKGEAYSDELISDDGERMVLLKQLPMTYAIQVAFFLNVCVNTWRNTSLSSVEKVEVEEVSLN